MLILMDLKKFKLCTCTMVGNIFTATLWNLASIIVATIYIVAWLYSKLIYYTISMD